MLEWITKDNRKIPLDEMEQKHLQAAFITMCSREYKHFQEINRLSDKINQLQEFKEAFLEEAARRGVKLSYPDECFPSTKWGEYFFHERRIRTEEAADSVKTEPVVTTTLG